MIRIVITVHRLFPALSALCDMPDAEALHGQDVHNDVYSLTLKVNSGKNVTHGLFLNEKVSKKP